MATVTVAYIKADLSSMSFMCLRLFPCLHHNPSLKHMKMKSLALLSALLAATAIATPTPTIEKRATTWCSAFGSLQTGGYTVYHNNWGAAQATSGSQCTTFNGLNGNSAVWETSWTWQGGPYSVKSYSNVALENINKQVWEIKSIPSTWTWRSVALVSASVNSC
jgi:hypothetical protein